MLVGDAEPPMLAEGADLGCDARLASGSRLNGLEIMRHCVALPWDAKTGSPPVAGVVRVAGWRGFLR